MHRAGKWFTIQWLWLLFSSNLKGWFEHHAGDGGVHGRIQTCDLWINQSVQGKVRLLPLEASLSSLGLATFPLIDPSLDV